MPLISDIIYTLFAHDRSEMQYILMHFIEPCNVEKQLLQMELEMTKTNSTHLVRTVQKKGDMT